VKSAKTHRSLVEFAPGGRTPHFVEVTSRPLEGPEGTSVGRILQLRDATSHQNLTERLKQKITSLESYVHTVSHDLRSPLVSLLGFTRLMRDDFGEMLGETGRRFLDRIEQAGSNMNTLTQDLLELSTQSQPGTSRKAVDPLNVLLQIRAEIKPRLEEQGIELWLPPAPSMIQCDRTQLYQVFSNLIVNALQHMGPCEAPRIAIEIQELQGEHVIVVRDNGRGIEASAHAKIFDAFQTLSRDASMRSTGVGLSIVKKIALSYQGRVWVESEPGHGAAFFVSLKHS
jgi:signal transduction histidine kinase